MLRHAATPTIIARQLAGNRCCLIQTFLQQNISAHYLEFLFAHCAAKHKVAGSNPVCISMGVKRKNACPVHCVHIKETRGAKNIPPLWLAK